MQTISSAVFQHPAQQDAVTTPMMLNALQRDSSELNLLKLLLQHRRSSGWVVVIAPKFKPAKAFWQACQLPLKRILFVYPTSQISVDNAIAAALRNQDCQVIINCATLVSSEQQRCQQLALQQGKVFHTLSELQQQTH